MTANTSRWKMLSSVTAFATLLSVACGNTSPSIAPEQSLAVRGAVERALAETGARQIEVDLAGVGYVDSSALGMLLMLRDKARMVGRPVVIAGAQGSVRQVLEIANFAKLFSIL